MKRVRKEEETSIDREYQEALTTGSSECPFMVMSNISYQKYAAHQVQGRGSQYGDQDVTFSTLWRRTLLQGRLKLSSLKLSHPKIKIVKTTLPSISWFVNIWNVSIANDINYEKTESINIKLTLFLLCNFCLRGKVGFWLGVSWTGTHKKDWKVQLFPRQTNWHWPTYLLYIYLNIKMYQWRYTLPKLYKSPYEILR